MTPASDRLKAMQALDPSLPYHGAGYSPEVRAMLDETTDCLCCGKPLRYLRKNGRRNRGYCSMACYRQKPPRMAYAERELGEPIREAIVGRLNRGQTTEAVAGQMGIRKDDLIRWLKFMGVRRVVRWE